MADKILFETEVGSGMWGMRTPESDYDIIQVYQQSTKDILSGKEHMRNKPQKKFWKDNIEWDYQFFEIGHLVNLLIKGNVNAIWAVTSPTIISAKPDCLSILRKITEQNLSKASHNSIWGMSINQYRDDEKRPVLKSNKAYKTCLRTLTFGINLFETGTLKFIPVQHTVTKEELDEAFIRLNAAYEATKLITQPNELVFRDFLYKLRLEEVEVC